MSATHCCDRAVKKQEQYSTNPIGIVESDEKCFSKTLCSNLLYFVLFAIFLKTFLHQFIELCVQQ